jgi:ATP-dependent helicase HepA
VHRFLERPSFNAGLMKTLADTATEKAAVRAQVLTSEAQTRAIAALSAELQRLLDLRRLNDYVRPEEIALAREQLERTKEAIAQARLRLDSVRLVVETPGGA